MNFLGVAYLARQMDDVRGFDMSADQVLALLYLSSPMSNDRTMFRISAVYTIELRGLGTLQEEWTLEVDGPVNPDQIT